MMNEPDVPIIYVRGYAMTASERDETAADPFCGFNVGSTLYRAVADRQSSAKKFVFESPVVRLVSEFQYRNVYQDGFDILDPNWENPPGPDGVRPKGIPRASIIIYRYYDPGSNLVGNGKSQDIRVYAAGLGRLILKVRELVFQRSGPSPDDDNFRCYLVAHSMGGLVVRTLLQNKHLEGIEPAAAEVARKSVAKVFTYATPHNGIEFAGINVPAWLTQYEMATFNRSNMEQYLATPAVGDRVDFLPDDIWPPGDKWFTMIGSNRGDYETAEGVSRMFAGHGSDGLVKIENASLWYRETLPTNPSASLGEAHARVTNSTESGVTLYKRVASAYAYRSHSGYFGIVNSEEAYQNLVRFLFGDVRVEVWLDVEKVTLPRMIQGKDVRAVYQVELVASTNGKRWSLSRRIAEEDSPACPTHDDLTSEDPERKKIYLSTIFMANRAKVDPARPGLTYAMTLGVRVPDYEVDRKFWIDGHFEGSNLFRDMLVVNLLPPAVAGDKWTVRHGWQSKQGAEATIYTNVQAIANGKLEMIIPLWKSQEGPPDPSISGNVRFVASLWK